MKMKEALENILPHLKEMDGKTAVKTLKDYGLWNILPKKVQYGLETYGTQPWVIEAYRYLREVNRVANEKEKERAKNPLNTYAIPVL